MLNKEAFIISLKLFVITAVAALCLAAVNMVTAPVIAENALKSDSDAQREVLEAAKEFKKTEFSEKDIPVGAQNGVRIESLNIGLDGSTAVGYVVTAVSNAGYGGDIRVMVGIDSNTNVTRVKILEASETAGLGANASKPEFIDQYIGTAGELMVVKGDNPGDGEIAAISGATITSKAVTSCVNAAIEQVKATIASGNADTAAAVNEKLEETKKVTDMQINSDKEGN